MNLNPSAAPDETAGTRVAKVSFAAHLELLKFFLARRDEATERIQALLNAQRKPLDYLRDRALLSRHFEECFFSLPRISPGQTQLRGQLEDAHFASGFRPRELPGLHNGLVDPAEMMIRAFYLWQQTRWPGRNGRARYAQTLFNLYLIRQLALLAMRVWDEGPMRAAERLSQVQAVLDELWKGTAPHQPPFVRDARWLIPLAQSPATDDLAPYFDIVRKVSETLPEKDRLEVHKAGVRMAAGHLRSQIHYFAMRLARPSGAESRVGQTSFPADVVLNTRNTNALDYALLIQELVPLLDAYEMACRDGDIERRIGLAGVICQGVSPDPDLFLNRVKLLGAYSMIEHLFVTTDGEGRAVYTPAGLRHVRLLGEYEERIGRVSRLLLEDCGAFRPVAGAYSPYGILYGFTSDLLEHMALKTLQPDAISRFGLEDVFADATDVAGKLQWVNGWRRLPHVAPEVQKLFDYPQRFAEESFERIERALHARVSSTEADAWARTGRLIIQPASAPQHPDVAHLPELPARHVHSTDKQLVEEQKAELGTETQILSDRREARCLLSYKTPGGWVAIRKTLLTDVLGEGRDARIVGLPSMAASVLKLMCRDLATLSGEAEPPSAPPES